MYTRKREEGECREEESYVDAKKSGWRSRRGEGERGEEVGRGFKENNGEYKMHTAAPGNFPLLIAGGGGRSFPPFLFPILSPQEIVE